MVTRARTPRRKKPSSSASKGGQAKARRDENVKDLFEIGDWARNDITMERVGKSVRVYSFVKDGLSRGERADDRISHVASGNTVRAILHDHLYEEKKGGASAGVFPVGIDVIPPFSVIEVVLAAGNTKSYDEGFAVNIARVRPCSFSLYSMMGPLGLGLLPSTYEAGTVEAEAALQLSPGLGKMLEAKNIGFFARIAQGSYVTKYSEDTFRLVGPKEDPHDPLSRHLDVVEGGGVFAITIAKRDVLRFTNAVIGGDEEAALVYAQCLLDLAAAAGALSCYVTHNEYLMRKDPNGIPYSGVPLIDSNKLLECVSLPMMLVGGTDKPRFELPFSVVNMESPFLQVHCACVDNNSSGEDLGSLPCPDLVFASENAPVRYAYPLSLGDATDSEFMRILFVPKAFTGTCGSAAASGGGAGAGLSSSGGGLERQDYRLLKRARKDAGGAVAAPPPVGA